MTQTSPRPAVRAFLALGSNLGDRPGAINAAFRAVGELPGTRALRLSEIIATEPVGPIKQGEYLNAAMEIETTLGPRELLEGLLGIERRLGRDRGSGVRWGPRTIDLDLLLYGDQVIDEPGLSVPHPRLHERLFVLGPLSQLAPGLIVPGLNATTARLRERLMALGSKI